MEVSTGAGPEDLLATAEALKGKRVKVTVGKLTVTGKLLDVAEFGGARIELDSGGVVRALPVLAIEEADDD